MKRKYLALIMSCFLCTSLFVTGCGKTAEVMEEDDEDEDDEEEDDDDDEDDDDEDDKDDEDDDDQDEKPSAVQIVKEIDGDTLLDQLRVFIDNKDQWAKNEPDDGAIDKIGYCITDLDHNGRAELIVTRNSDYSTYSESLIYEINENGDGIVPVSLSYSASVVTGDQVPDLMEYGYLESYFDKEKSEVHYLGTGNFDNGNGNYGAVFSEMIKKGEEVVIDDYLTISVQETVDQETYEYSYDHEYFSGDDTISESEYYDIIGSYPEGITTKPVFLGYYQRYYYQDLYLKDLDDVSLKNVLYDSYCVFNGTVNPDEYNSMYNPTWEALPDIDLSEQAVGSWSLYSTEVEGDVTYYDWDSSTFYIVEIYSDHNVYFMEYENQTLVSDIDMEMYYEDGYPAFKHDVYGELGKPDEFGVVEEDYMITNWWTEGNDVFLEISRDLYGEDGWLGYDVMTFIRNEG